MAAVSKSFSSLSRLEAPLAWGTGAFFLLAFVRDFFGFETVLHPEDYLYVPFYGRASATGLPGELAKTFDVCSVETCLGRFRPLGHLLELVDAKIMRALAPAWDSFGFHSLLQLGFGLAVAFLLMACAGRIFAGIPRAQRWLLGAFFAVGTPLLVMNQIYFRPAKAMGACAAALILYRWLRAREPGAAGPPRVASRAAWKAAGRTFVFALLATGDEQVVLVLAILLGASALEWLTSRRPHAAFSIPALSALLVYAAGALWLGPWVHARFSSGPVINDYVSAGSFVELNIRLFRDAIRLALFEFGAFFGNLPDGSVIPGVAGLAGLAGLCYAGPVAKAGKSDRFPRWLPAYFAAATVAMLYLLACRHRPILGEFVKRSGYYYLTPVLLLYAGLLIWLARNQAPRSAGRRVLLTLILLGVGLGNLVTLRELRRPGADPDFDRVSENSRRLRELAARPPGGSPLGADAFSGLSPEALGFYRYLRADVFGRRDSTPASPPAVPPNAKP